MYSCVLLDDEYAIVHSLRQTVDWGGYGFYPALVETNPMRALEYIRAHPVDLLLTDVQMPGMSGIELMRRLRGDGHDISTIIISAFEDFGYVQQALKLGAENYLLKPIDTEELSDTLRQVANHLDEHDRYRRLEPLDVFRSNLTERWLKNGISPHELTEKAAFLRGSAVMSDLRAAFIRVRDEADIMRVYSLALDSFSGILHGYPFFERSNLLMCALNAASARPAVDALAERARADGLDLCIGLGASANYHTIHSSYLGALALLPLSYTGCAIVEERDANGRFDEMADLPSLKKAIGDQFSQRMPFTRQDANGALRRAFLLSKRDAQGEDVRWLSQCPKGEDASLLYPWILGGISRLMESEQPARVLHPCVSRAIDILHESHAADYSMQTLAERLGISATYFGRIFKEQTGLCFSDYRQREQLEHARKLILETKMKMSDIAQQCGFASQTYFNRSFKRASGVSPLNLRHS